MQGKGKPRLQNVFYAKLPDAERSVQSVRAVCPLYAVSREGAGAVYRGRDVRLVRFVVGSSLSLRY